MRIEKRAGLGGGPEESDGYVCCYNYNVSCCKFHMLFMARYDHMIIHEVIA